MDNYAMDSASTVDDSNESADEIESGDENGDLYESCCFGDEIVHIPQCFCMDEEIVNEVLSPAIWRNVFNSKHGKRLRKLLPVFPEEDEKEKNITLRKLVYKENFKFGVPFKDFFRKLKDGFLSNDIAEVTKALRKAKYKDYKSQQKRYSYQLFRNILFSRKKLLNASYSLPPGQPYKMQQFVAKPKDVTLSERTRLRYFSALQDLREEVGEIDTSSEDENYPESSPPKVSRKFKKQHQNHDSSNSEVSRITATTSFPPELPGSGHFLNQCLEMFEISEERYREMVDSHKIRILLSPSHPQLKTSHIELKGIITRCNLNKRSSSKISDSVSKKKAKVPDTCENLGLLPNNAESMDKEKPISLAHIVIKEEPKIDITKCDVVLEAVPSSLQDIEVQTDSLSVQEVHEARLGDLLKSKLPSPRPQVHHYPTCFFALLRDLFCTSPEQKLSAVKLEEKVKNWQSGPTAALFEWSHIQDSWSDLVSSALKFLAGDLINILPETFVPFLDYKEKQQQWQWIGSGRDSDEQMFELCQQWLDNKDDISSDILEISQGSPPPPRMITGWTVSPSSEEEKTIYHLQECIRYQNPHRAFTFKVHGYEAVVGPVKGVYGKESGVNKAREHSLLTSDRPPFVTILSLVRDSAARLPNGEGTRADICELLKDSQYLAPASEQQIHTVVSGALDRLHYEKDPCVKYDVNRKLWIYLHRHRTEEEFERIHQAQAAAAKARKAIQKTKIPKIKNKDVVRAFTSAHVIPNSENVALLNVDIPAIISTGQSSQSPRSGTSPRTQGNRLNFSVHAIPGATQKEVKCSVIGLDNQSKNIEVIKTEPLEKSPPSNTHSFERARKTVASTIPSQIQVRDINTTRQSQFPNLSFPYTKSIIGNVNGAQIVNVTPIQIRPCSDQIRNMTNISSNVHDVLNVDMKPSSPSFVGQPPVLQPIITHHSVEKKTPVTTVSTSVTPSIISTSTPVATKTKVTCANLSNLQAATISGFQTIVIKQEPGLRTCNGVSTIPLLSIEERLPSGNQTSIGSGPVVARLLHGSQYLSFGNLVASSPSSSTAKQIPGSVQNFRVQGGNICQQVLSTSTIKVMHSAPVSGISDPRLPVIALKNQLGSVKDQSVITQTPTSLNVCGRLYQMTNIRNAMLSKDSNETKISDISTLKESNVTVVKDSNIPDATFPALSVATTIYNTPLVITNRNPQAVLKVTPSGS
ncbi:hypothetical protein JTE90_002846 [Oedothorax gibbosus]|uniref:DEUBAD domain-containing protein n=1 Tax=Oedothorax gibbosus TaxID=931172 RepID=A0AAV6UHC9_9ARAC|nr:hypothetical protein JTE90_002846 [Oedothorax gibbosus]